MRFLKFFRIFRNRFLRFSENKTQKNASSWNLQNLPFKIHGKKGDTENLKSSLRIAPKNLKKFVVIYHEKMYLRAYFHIFLSSRVLRRKNVLIIDFSPCNLYGKLRPFGGGGQFGRPSHHMEYFLLFFSNLFTCWQWWKSRFGK